MEFTFKMMDFVARKRLWRGDWRSWKANSASMCVFHTKVTDFMTELIESSTKMTDFPPKIVDFNTKMVECFCWIQRLTGLHSAWRRFSVRSWALAPRHFEPGWDGAVLCIPSHQFVQKWSKMKILALKQCDLGRPGGGGMAWAFLGEPAGMLLKKTAICYRKREDLTPKKRMISYH